MSLSLKPLRLYRPIYYFGRQYSDEDKTRYQILEAGQKPKLVHGKPYAEWRKPWIQRDGEFRSKLSVFVERNPSPDILHFMSQLPNLTTKTIKNWWLDMKELQDIENQRYLPKRVATLGSNLAAAHFFTFRNCAVRLKDSEEWISGDATTLNLPDRYVNGYFIEAVDCTNFFHGGIRYEGLQNLSNLSFLRWLSLRDNKFVDVWGLDRVAGQNGDSLEFLDISGCNICVGCIFALAKMRALKYVILTDPGDNLNLQAAISILEHERPDLLVKAI
ncbi:uncharacterized protein LOC111364917 [Spodoptera litura]|uniref:Uncharacterized protein LOC111364917 n=1 Tax=Spodoptera litura TaxID=69820 RepID=A0A9J7J6H6_SPOLT|nr:uncharacterized protein LOC111364917 [Spodoptera litura]